ncbi:MAG: PAS domain S-box protein [Balneolales bacterium]
MLNKKQLNVILRCSPAPILILSPNAPVFTVKEVNEAYLTITNTKRDHILNKSVYEAFPDNPGRASNNGVHILEASLLKVMSAKAPHKISEMEYDIPVRGTDEFLERHWVCDNIPVLDEDGEIELIINSPSDITKFVIARKKEEIDNQKLQHQQEQYRSLFDQNPDAVFSSDLDGNFTSANESLARMSGYTIKELLGNTFSPFVVPEDLERVKSNFKRAIQGEHQNYNLGVIAKTGKRLVLNITKMPIVISGKITGVYGIAKDITAWLQTEAKLKHEKQRFKALVQDSSDMISILDSEANYKYSSPSTKIILGLSPDSLLGTNAIGYIHEDDKEAALEHLGKLSKKKSVHVPPFRFRNGDNQWRWIDTMLTDMQDDPAVNGIVANSRDVTEIVEKELKLKEINERYNNVTKATRDTIWEHDLRTNKIIWNGDIKSIFGYELDGLATDWEWWVDRIHPEDVDRVNALYNHNMKHDIQNQQYEYRFRCHNGRYKHVSDKGFLVRDDSGKFVKLVGSMRDVTREKEEEERLLIMESVIVNTTDSVLILDARKPDYPIIYANQAYLDMSGYSKNEIIGKSVYQLFVGPEINKKELEKIKQALHEKEACEVEYFSCKKSGEAYWKTINLIPVKDAKGQCTHFVTIQRNITARKEQEREKEQMISELTQNNKDLRMFSYITSHNLRAPLANLTGLIQLFDEVSTGDEELLEIVDGFRSSTQMLNQTITDLNDILVVKDNLSIEQEEIRFEQIVKEVFLQTRHLYADVEHHINLNFNDAPSVIFNRAYLESIFLNLFTNAFKYRSPSRKLEVTIKAMDMGDHLLLKFQDNGIGLNTKRHKNRLFGLYQKFHNYPDSKGLGLYLVRSQLEALGGSIEMESEVDKGSVFILAFKKAD